MKDIITVTAEQNETQLQVVKLTINRFGIRFHCRNEHFKYLSQAMVKVNFDLNMPHRSLNKTWEIWGKEAKTWAKKAKRPLGPLLSLVPLAPSHCLQQTLWQWGCATLYQPHGQPWTTGAVTVLGTWAHLFTHSQRKEFWKEFWIDSIFFVQLVNNIAKLTSCSTSAFWFYENFIFMEKGRMFSTECDFTGVREVRFKKVIEMTEYLTF